MRITNATCRMCIAILIFLLLTPLHAQQYGWVKIAQPTTSFISAVNFVDSLNGWIGCILADADQAIFRTSDGGYAWQRQIAPQAINVNSIGFVDPQHGWIVGNLGNAFGYIIHTENSGLDWEEQLNVLRHFYYGLGALNPLHATVTGSVDSFFTYSGLVVRTSNGGKNWREQRFLRGIGKADFVDARHGWASAAIGDSIRFIHTVDGGNTWEIQPYDLGIEFLGVPYFDFIDSLHGWAVGSGRGIDNYPVVIGTQNAGATWEKLHRFPSSQNIEPSFGDVAFADTLNGWLFGNAFFPGEGLAGVIYRTTDGGQNWMLDFKDPHRAWTNGEALDLEHVWATTGIGEVWRYKLITRVDEPVQQIPANYALLQNYPNPFNPTTEIEYHLPKRTRVLLAVHNLLGKEVRTLVREVQGPGTFRITFDAINLPSGAYYYTLKTDDFEQTKSMRLLK